MRVNSLVKYTIRLEPGLQTCEQTLGLASGSCRDSAWLLVQLLRSHGIAARFVSGYLIQVAPDEPASDPGAPQVDSADLHAWTEAFLPGAGWIGFDSTSGLMAGESRGQMSTHSVQPSTHSDASMVTGTSALVSTSGMMNSRSVVSNGAGGGSSGRLG